MIKHVMVVDVAPDGFVVISRWHADNLHYKVSPNRIRQLYNACIDASAQIRGSWNDFQALLPLRYGYNTWFNPNPTDRQLTYHLSLPITKGER